MSLKQRRSDKQSAEAEDNNINGAGAGGTSSAAAHRITSPSLSKRAVTVTLTAAANLTKLLPTGTVLVFQALIPVFTNKGSCDSVTHILTLGLLLLLAFSCILACFTDTVKSSNGKRIYHGIATFKGLWLLDYSPIVDTSTLPDLAKYKINLMDFVHAFLSVLVFFAVALTDKNVLACYYPKPGTETKELLYIIPLGVGTLCSSLFTVFPTTRHGIGYPLTSDPK
ncbi:unnamed protein product [Vicia faba]|uniref:Uncharacterized protein n=1 Tax=Vicia faba TaxID=3906 RepID=A0AAV0Z0M2_VICFA|nr:unnamed protein product [Vicia faba]